MKMGVYIQMKKIKSKVSFKAKWELFTVSIKIFGRYPFIWKDTIWERFKQLFKKEEIYYLYG